MDCEICKKEATDTGWIWGGSPAHKECVVDEADAACDEMNCFSITDEIGQGCEDGSKLKPLTQREKKALLK